MPRSFLQNLLIGLLAGIVGMAPLAQCHSEEITSKAALEAIEKAKRYLLRTQASDGSWPANGEGGGGVRGDRFTVGFTSMAILALLNTGMTIQDKEIQRALTWLRSQEVEQTTYDVSLMIQALAAAKDGKRDFARVAELARRLEMTQLKSDANAGSWGYPTGPGDRSNAQFAILGLREAQEMGVPVGLDVWRRARQHWVRFQNRDGSWCYSGRGPGSGSMTVAGIATIVITEAMLRAEQKEQNADGSPICCGDSAPEKVLEDACKWLGEHFQVRMNPGLGTFYLYYMYGLEPRGRFSGRRFFVNDRGDRHDWYREGAEYLVAQQNKLTGSWKGAGHMEDHPILATSYALMFLSKGLAPVLINKLEYGGHKAKVAGVVGHDWNLHPGDVRNLTQLITNLDRWPRMLTWQVVDVTQASVADLMQAPVLFFHGTEAPKFTEQEVALLREYVLQGGFIFAVRGCKSTAFDEGFRDLIRRMYPPSEAQLKKLDGTHPVFRSEYPLIDKETGEPTAELWGVDVGCRTSIMYSPDDISCLWNRWTSFETPKRTREMSTMITKATRVGVNVVAYVTGREVINKLQQQESLQQETVVERAERDLLQIAKLRYTGDWDAAPQALKNLLAALSRTAGLPTAAKHHNLTAVDPALLDHPMIYMHGRHDFALGKNEQDKLRGHLLQGGFLFADACCGVPSFDTSFRRLMEQIFPDNKLKRIPPDHEIFTTKLNGFELKTVKRREPDVDLSGAAMQSAVRTVEPFLEGIEIDGRYVVVYSKYDISCALERQASVACTGYLHEDAVKLGVNIVLYGLLQ